MGDLSTSLAGKTAIVTGATSGLGLEVAAELAKRGACVVFAVRNADKATRVEKELRAKLPKADLVIPGSTVPTVDFASQESVRAFAQAILNTGQHGSPVHLPPTPAVGDSKPLTPDPH